MRFKGKRQDVVLVGYWWGRGGGKFCRKIGMGGQEKE